MLKKIISFMLVVALMGILPLVAGCEKNEYKSHTQTETQVKQTREVVE